MSGMTKEQRRAISEAFRLMDKALARHVKHLQQSIAKIDISEREHQVEIRDELKKVNRRLTAIERMVDETSRHAKFTSASVVQLTRALEAAGVIGKLEERKGTAYSQVLNPKGRNRS